MAFQFIGTQLLDLCFKDSFSKTYSKTQKNNKSEEDSNEKSEKNNEDDKIDFSISNDFKLILVFVNSKLNFQFQSNLHLRIIQDIPLLPPKK